MELRRAGALLAATVVLLSGCSDTDPGSNAGPGPRSPAPSPTTHQGSDMSLVYLRGTTILERKVAGGPPRKLLRVPTPDVFAAPAGGWVAVVVPVGAGEEDFYGSTRLRLVHLDGGSVDMGLGSSPLWSHEGGQVAFLRPVGERVCEGEACFGGSEVRVAEPGEDSRRLLGSGTWSLLGWSGQDLLVSDGRADPSVVAVHQDGTTDDRLPFSPSEIWDGTPLGRFVVVDGNEARLSESRGDVEEPFVTGGTLAEGSWAPTETLGAAVLLGKGSRLVVFGEDGSPARPVEGSKGAAGPVLWAPDGRAFSYVRAVGGTLEARVCRLDGGCRSVLTWREGIVPLALR